MQAVHSVLDVPEALPRAQRVQYSRPAEVETLPAKQSVQLVCPSEPVLPEAPAVLILLVLV